MTPRQEAQRCNDVLYKCVHRRPRQMALVPKFPPVQQVSSHERYHNTIVITVSQHNITSGETYRHHPLLACFRQGGCGGGAVADHPSHSY
jgi:hypothetical protein